MNTFKILDGKPQENGRFGDLGNNKKITLIICLVELKCDINLTELANTEITTFGVGETR